MHRAALQTSSAPGEVASASESHIGAVETLRLRDGRALSARQWPGAGEHTLVLLHGLFDCSEGWADVCEEFGCRRIAFDPAGFGHSDAPSRGSIASYAADIAEGLELLGVRRFTAVGHSLGGAVATALAELLPDRVAALVLLAPAGFGRAHLAETVMRPGVRNVVLAALPMALSSRLAVTATYAALVTNRALPDPALVDRLTIRAGASLDGAREGARAVAEAGRGHDAFHRRRVGYHGPVFAAWGDRDRVVPSSHRHGLRVAFPHAHIHLWRGMGHHPVREGLDELVALVRRAAAASRPHRPLVSVKEAAAA